MKYDVDTALLKVDKWKAHILRAAHQSDVVKPGPPDNGLGHDVFASESWQLTVALTKSDSDDIEVNTKITYWSFSIIVTYFMFVYIRPRSQGNKAVMLILKYRHVTFCLFILKLNPSSSFVSAPNLHPFV